MNTLSVTYMINKEPFARNVVHSVLTPGLDKVDPIILYGSDGHETLKNKNITDSTNNVTASNIRAGSSIVMFEDIPKESEGLLCPLLDPKTGKASWVRPGEDHVKEWIAFSERRNVESNKVIEELITRLSRLENDNARLETELMELKGSIKDIYDKVGLIDLDEKYEYSPGTSMTVRGARDILDDVKIRDDPELGPIVDAPIGPVLSALCTITKNSKIER